MSEITELLHQINVGDTPARERLYALLYGELRALARSRLRRSETITLLDTTSLVHEAYLRFLGAHQLSFSDRGRFFAFAATIMRTIVIDEIRKRRADRRGGAAEHVPIDDQLADQLTQDENEVMRVHEALAELSSLDPRLGRVVEMRYFAGLTEEEVADSLGVTSRTVRRDWDKARTLLFSALK